ncbi:MAG: HipA family kinase [Acidobacteriaceae bacterium]
MSKLNGCSQPSIVMSTGGELWVLKWRSGGCRDGALKEVVGTELMAAMGLPVPRWSAVVVTEEFLDRFPEAWFERSSGEWVRPEAGLHFGSSLTLSASGLPTYQVIPRSWHDRVANRRDFVGALVADLWMNNCDRRQCLFLSAGESLRVEFIDHDCCLGGFHGEGVTSARQLTMPNPELYRDALDASVVAEWMGKVEGLGAEVVEQILERIPEEWADAAALKRTSAQLLRRRNRLEGWMAEAVAYLRDAAAGLDVSCRPAILARLSRGAGLSS